MKKKSVKLVMTCPYDCCVEKSSPAKGEHEVVPKLTAVRKERRSTNNISRDNICAWSVNLFGLKIEEMDGRVEEV
jgi:hypothetical protein